MATEQRVQVSNPNSRMDVCSGSDSNLRGGPGLFSAPEQNMTVAPQSKLNPLPDAIQNLKKN